MAILTATNIRKRFGGILALDGAEFTLDAGEVHALLGSNGCGKSTLCKIIAGSVEADSGDLIVDGHTVSFASPAEASRGGIEMFYQELSLIPAMTVAENICLGREPKLRNGLVDRDTLRATAARLMTDFGAALGRGVNPDSLVYELSSDQRQIVEFLKVLNRGSRIIVLDEATAALDRDQVEIVFTHIKTLKEAGRSIVFISHRMDEVFAIADRITVMRNGRTVTTNQTLRFSREDVVAAMVGAAATGATGKPKHDPSEERILSIESLAAGRLSDISLSVRRGEILGLGGLHGQGQSDLLRALYGVLPIKAGSITLGGHSFVPDGPLSAMRHSMAYISGDRAKNGVMAIRPIFENLVLSMLARNRTRIVAPSHLRAVVQPLIELLKLKFPSLDAPVSALSGGNQQKVVIARLLATEPILLLLDDPTKGIDLGTKADLYALMDDLCARGVTMLLHSSDDKELLEVSDRVLVFNAGHMVAELTGKERNEVSLYHAAYLSQQGVAGHG
jgi:ribose transport system ATP-binding protein